MGAGGTEGYALKERHMRTLRLLAMVAAIAMTGAAWAQHNSTTQPKDKERDPLDAPYYRMVVKELNLNTEKQGELRKKLEARREAMTEWNKSEKGKKLEELNKKLEAARKEKNKDEIQKLEADIKPLREDRSKFETEEDAKVMTFFTAEQKPVLAAISAYTGAMRKFSKADLTEDQKAKTMKIAKEFGPKFVDAKEKAQKEELRQKFYTQVEENVLTAKQREELAKSEKTTDTRPAKEEHHRK